MPKVTVDGIELEVPQGAPRPLNGWIRLICLFAMVAAPAVAHEGFAQPKTSEATEFTLTETTSAEDRQDLHRIGRCVVQSKRAEVREIVLGWADDPKTLRGIYTLVGEKCLGPSGMQLRIQPVRLMYVLADTMVSSELENLQITNAAIIPALNHPKVDSRVYEPRPGEVVDETLLKAKAQLRASFERAIQLSELGECVVRADPIASRILLESAPGSVDERQHTARLAKTLDDCVGVGNNIFADMTTLRGVMASNYYRLALAERRDLD